MVIKGFKEGLRWVGWGDCKGKEEQIHGELVGRCSGTQSGRSTDTSTLKILVEWGCMDFLSVTKQWWKASAGEPCWAFYQCPLVYATALGPRRSHPLSSDASGCCGSVNVPLPRSGPLSHFTSSKWPLSWLWQGVGTQPDSVANMPGPADTHGADTTIMRGKGCLINYHGLPLPYRGGTKDRDKASHPGWWIRWLEISPNCLNLLNHVLTVGPPCWHPPPLSMMSLHPVRLKIVPTRETSSLPGLPKMCDQHPLSPCWTK